MTKRQRQNAWLKKKRSSRGGEVREQTRRHRAKSLGAEGGGCPPGWELAQYAHQQGRCWWCCDELPWPDSGPLPFHADHVQPLCRGGRHEPANLVLSCPRCNTMRTPSPRGVQEPELEADGSGYCAVRSIG